MDKKIDQLKKAAQQSFKTWLQAQAELRRAERRSGQVPHSLQRLYQRFEFLLLDQEDIDLIRRRVHGNDARLNFPPSLTEKLREGPVLVEVETLFNTHKRDVITLRVSDLYQDMLGEATSNPARLKAYDSEYDPTYCNPDLLCVCGHAYYRHFDTYERMAPVGCKYCDCQTYRERKK